MAARQSNKWDSILKAIAKEIPGNDAIDSLGIALGFTPAETQNFIRTNSFYHEVTNDGTVAMLRKWSHKVSPSTCRSDLRRALMKAELVRIAELHLPLDSSLISISEVKQSALTHDEVVLLKNDLQSVYQRKYSTVRSFPLDGKSPIKLEEIRTNLVMFNEGMKGNETKMNCDDFIKYLERTGCGEGLGYRTAISGEAGVGKTTLLARIAHDWASGKHLQGFELLFVIPLRKIDETKHFGDTRTLRDSMSGALGLDGERIDEYVQKNQQKVLILYDGLDEYGHDFITESASKDAAIAVLRGDKFTDVQVIVTTRPWKARDIMTDTKLEERYKFVELEGFKRGDVISYISKVFDKNKAAGDSLISLMTNNNSLVAEKMAPYPIYCSMLCHIWQNDESGSAIQGQETLSQLFRMMVNCLEYHYAAKGATKHMRWGHGRNCFEQVDKYAMDCLLRNQLVFEEKDLEMNKDVLSTALEIGILTQEEPFVCVPESSLENSRFVVNYRFPHKLFQEYLAGVHLARTFRNDLNEFNRLTIQVMDDYRRYQYLLYFTASQGIDVGKAVLDNLTKVIDDDHDFLVEVAFECHEMDALEPLILHLNTLHSLKISGPSHHTASGWAFTWKACKYFLQSIRHANGSTTSAGAANDYARSICTMPNLQTLDLDNANLEDNFFFTLAASASESKLHTIRHANGTITSDDACKNYARSICTMPNLQTLEIDNLIIADSFFSTLVALAPESKLQTIRHANGTITSYASKDYGMSICTMPNLQTLELDNLNLADSFFLTLVASATESKLQSIRHANGCVTAYMVSINYARTICTMPSLHTLELDNLIVADSFYSTLVASASESKIRSIRHANVSINSTRASEDYARSICIMPNLQTLELDNLIPADSFFATLVASASESKLQSIRHANGTITSEGACKDYARSICTMPNLQTLELNNLIPAESFFSILVASASQSKLQSIRHANGSINSARASEDYARSICTMPNLQTLELDNFIPANSFFSSLVAHTNGTITSEGACIDYARSICNMPNLQTLELNNQIPADRFFLTFVSSASQSKLQSIRHANGSINSTRASEDYARSICTMPNLQTLELDNLILADSFFSTFVATASQSKLQSMRHANGSITSDCASKHYAMCICTMPNLQILELNNLIPADRFFSTLVSTASQSKLRSIRHANGSINSVRASEDYARSICAMPNLQTLEFNNLIPADSFFSTIVTSASESKLQSIRHANGTISSEGASRNYARSICTMPNLQTLEFDNLIPAHSFFSALAASAPQSQLETMRHANGTIISHVACKDYARSICTMPNLQTLELNNLIPADSFFSTLVASASISNLHTIRHANGSITIDGASKNYARSICTMPNLRTLELDNLIPTDGFYSTLVASALQSKLRSIRHANGTITSDGASKDYARSICTMPNLQTLELNNLITADSFFSTLVASASESKLHTIRHANVTITSDGPSKDYARSICAMPNLQTLELDNLILADGFFSTFVKSASQSKLHTIRHANVMITSDGASKDYARSICTLPNLQTLELDNLIPAPCFFSTLVASSSDSKLHTIRHANGTINSEGASEDYARSICTMPNLQALELDNLILADSFFSILVASASQLKLQSVRHANGFITSDCASKDYARSICTMPNLQTLELTNLIPTDSFFSTLVASAPQSKLLSIRHANGSITSDCASKDFARTICTMPNLQTLELDNLIPSDSFFSTLAESASQSQLQTIRHANGSITSDGTSKDYARNVCTMSNLQTLELDNFIPADSFFSTLVTSASQSKLHTIRHANVTITSDGASIDYARCICTMANLRILELINVYLADSFFSALATSASEAKVTPIFSFLCSVTSYGASKDYARSICTMSHLQTVKLENVYLADSFFSALVALASGAKLHSIVLTEPGSAAAEGHSKESGRVRSPIVHLCVDIQSFKLLRQLNMHSLCPEVKKITVFLDEEVTFSPDLSTALSLYSHVVELGLRGDIQKFVADHQLRQAFLKLRELTTLSVTNECVGDEVAEKLIRSVSSNPHLKNVKLIRCDTTRNLDPFVAKFEREGRCNLTVEHGTPHTDED
ncbi:uncharacterized protein [Diadema setosum]|uniref:uncharacterized protein n=1 Tax=Diadema setosum TaxID=31175 RepID=UPI003B3A913A